MRDHVGPGEVAWCAELPPHVLVEAEFQIAPSVAWAVERTHRGGGAAAAARLNGSRVEDELGMLIRPARVLECAGPGSLDVLEDVDREVLQVALWILPPRDRLWVVGPRCLHRRAEDVADVKAPARAAA